MLISKNPIIFVNASIPLVPINRTNEPDTLKINQQMIAVIAIPTMTTR